MSSYRNQLRAVLYQIWNKKIRTKHFRIVDSKNERTLGLLLPIENNLHIPNWLWYHGWKVVDYSGVVALHIPEQQLLNTDIKNNIDSINVEHRACMLLEVRKLEPGDKQYATHPKYNPDSRRPSAKSKPVLPKQA